MPRPRAEWRGLGRTAYGCVGRMLRPAFRETFRESLMLVAGVDSSTQSTKVVLCQAEDGAIVATGSASHPDGTECDPAYWWEALCRVGDGLLDRASAIGVAAQQHGMVALDDAGEVIRPAILWNDMRAAPQTRDLIAELGGPAEWARRTGSVP